MSRQPAPLRWRRSAHRQARAAGSRSPRGCSRARARRRLGPGPEPATGPAGVAGQSARGRARDGDRGPLHRARPELRRCRQMARRWRTSRSPGRSAGSSFARSTGSRADALGVEGSARAPYHPFLSPRRRLDRLRDRQRAAQGADVRGGAPRHALRGDAEPRRHLARRRHHRVHPGPHERPVARCRPPVASRNRSPSSAAEESTHRWPQALPGRQARPLHARTGDPAELRQRQPGGRVGRDRRAQGGPTSGGTFGRYVPSRPPGVRQPRHAVRGLVRPRHR